MKRQQRAHQETGPLRSGQQRSTRRRVEAVCSSHSIRQIEEQGREHTHCANFISKQFCRALYVHGLQDQSKNSLKMDASSISQSERLRRTIHAGKAYITPLREAID